MTARDLPDWVTSINKAIPAIITCGVVAIAGMMWKASGSLESQEKRIAEMQKTLQMVCEQLADKKAIDAVQTERINGLREDVNNLMR